MFWMAKPNYPATGGIFYNTKDPILSDDNFQTRLSFATSMAGERRRWPPQSAIYLGLHNSDVKDYLNNPAQTKQYLAKVKTAVIPPLP